jgi:type IV pilus assembly protein PilA
MHPSAQWTPQGTPIGSAMIRVRRARGFSLIELLIVVAIILIIAGIAIPSLLHAKMAANEASAVGSLRSINTGLTTYASTYGVGYPNSLADLGPSSAPSSTSADLLDLTLVSGTKSGYSFTYSPGAVGANGLISNYSITADPITRGTSGQRGFFTDTSLVIRENTTATATVSDSPLS